MRRFYVLIGGIAALGFALALVPAKAVALAVDRIDDLALLRIGGTVWKGHANILYRDLDAGRFAWRMDWPALFEGRLGVYWRLNGAGHDLSGRFQRGLAWWTVTVAGSIGTGHVNRLLRDYDIQVAGRLATEDLVVRSRDGVLGLAGQLRWTGGRTSYRLSGLSYDADLPPMVAHLQTRHGEVGLNASLEAESVPLLEARLRDGWMEVGITARLTRLAGKPWPGNAADHAVVLTVERELPQAWRWAGSFGATRANPR